MGDDHKTNVDMIEGSIISGEVRAGGDVVGRDKNTTIFQQIISSRLMWVVIVLLAFVVWGVWSNQNLPFITSLNRYLDGRRGDETLIVIAHFHAAEVGRASNVHHQLFNALQEEIANQQLTNVRVVLDSATLLSSQRAEAEAMGKEYDATMVIWGEDTEFEVVANYVGLRDAFVKEIQFATVESPMTYLVAPEQYQQFVVKDLSGSTLFLVLLTLGEGARLDERYEEAILLLNLSINKLPFNHQLTQQVGGAYYLLGYSYFLKNTELDLSNFVVYDESNKYEEAIIAWQKAIEIDSKNIYSHHSLGVVYDILGRYEEAIKAYEKAIKLDQQFAHPHYGLGDVYNELGEYDEAITAYQKAILLDSQNASYYYGLGIAYGRQEMYEEAIGTHQKAIGLAPQFANPHTGLGIVYYKLGMYDEAIKAHENALKLNPQYDVTYNGLGDIYADLRMVEKAIEAYQKAIELDPQYATPYNGLGNVYETLEKYQEAILAYQKYLELKPHALDKEEVEAKIQQLQQLLTP